MRLFSRSTLLDFARKHPIARGPLLAWAKEIEGARFATTAQLRGRYRSADFVGDKVVFNVGGKSYRLIVRIAYAQPDVEPPLNGMVFVLFVGTHAEYNRIDVAAL